jgi:hypothetical protein
MALINKYNGAAISQAQEIADTSADHFATQCSDSSYDEEFFSDERQSDTIGIEEIFKETDKNLNETFNILQVHTT